MKERILSSEKKLGEIEKNIGFLFLKSLKKYKDKPFFYYFDGGRWNFKTFGEIFEDAGKICFYLKKEGLLKKGERALTFSENSYDMLIWELALLFSGIASVSLWSGAEEELAKNVINQAKPSFGFVDSPKREKIIKKITKIKLFDPEEFERIRNLKISKSFVLNLIEKVEPDREAFIQFTSGSTGEMKWVVLTHKNICSQQKAFSIIWKIPASLIFLSYLPWHYSYGGLFERFIAINYGVYWYNDPQIGKDIDRLFCQWERVKPTHFFSVPKVYVEILKNIEEEKDLIRVFFHKNLKLLFTAGAPLSRKCADFFKKNGVVVMEGWSLTETSPTVTMTSPEGGRIHSYVGFPIPGCSVKIDREGEIYVKGPNVMKGYLNGKKRRRFSRMGGLKQGILEKLQKGV